MPTLKNITKKPISVPLPAGKRLFLGPGKSGNINPKASEHPPLVALVEAGELELEQKGGRGDINRSSGSTGSSGASHTPGKNVFRSGDG